MYGIGNVRIQELFLLLEALKQEFRGSQRVHDDEGAFIRVQCEWEVDDVNSYLTLEKCFSTRVL